MGSILSAIILENEGFSLNDLTSIQRMALKKAYTGRLEPDNVSEKETDILDSLVDLGLLDLGYDVTPEGEHAAKLIDKYSRNQRDDLMAAKEKFAKKERAMGFDNNEEDDFHFSEGEKIAIKNAGLNEDEMKAMFAVQHAMAKLDESIGELGLPQTNSIAGTSIKDLKELEETLNMYVKKHPGLRYIEDIHNEVKSELDRREHGAEENEYPEEPEDQYRDDAEADADTLASAGFGTDEDYGYYGGDDGW